MELIEYSEVVNDLSLNCHFLQAEIRSHENMYFHTEQILSETFEELSQRFTGILPVNAGIVLFNAKGIAIMAKINRMVNSEGNTYLFTGNKITLKISEKDKYTISYKNTLYCLENLYSYEIPVKVANIMIGRLGLLTESESEMGKFKPLIDMLGYQIEISYMKVYNDNYFKKITKHLKLTEHQIIILQLLGAGLTEEAVAQEMALSINTIKYHKKQILRELNSSCTLEAVIKALRFNLFSLDSLRGGFC